MRRRLAVISVGVIVAVLVGVSTALAACTIAASGLSFGAYNPFSITALDGAGTVTYDCSPLGILIRIDLDRGGAPTFTPRRLRQSATTLDYNLYRDPVRLLIWGDGTGGTQSYLALVTGLGDVVVPVYGRIPARQNVPPGLYTDTVTVTINF
jgi:spore coat protein U-like protein